MKKIVLLIIIGLIYAIHIEAKKIDGIIFFDNDTIHVKLDVPVDLLTGEIFFEKLQFKVKYYDSTGVKKVLKPNQAKEIRFKYEYENVRMLSRYNSLDARKLFSKNKNIFLKLAIDGKLKLFTYYYTKKYTGMSPSENFSGTGQFSNTYTAGMDRFVLQKEEGELKKVKGLTFKDDMLAYLNDCNALTQKIEKKEFRKDDLESMVRFYNTHCGK